MAASFELLLRELAELRVRLDRLEAADPGDAGLPELAETVRLASLTARECAELTGLGTDLRAILDNAYDAVFIHTLDGTVVDVNRKMLDMYSVSREEALKLSIRDDYSSSDNPLDSLPSIWEEVMSGREQLFEWHARRPNDGSVFDVEVYLRRITLQNSDVILANVRDITDRKRAEQERSALLHMMTHDIRGPLTVIDGYCEILSVELAGTEPQLMVEEIKKASNRISSFIQDMLDLSAMECGKLDLDKAPVSLQELVEQTVGENYMPAIISQVRLHVEKAGGLPMVHADKKHLGRAIENLVSNAVKFTGRHGQVTVRAGTTGAFPPMAFVEVADNGMGISEDDLPHVFEKYYRGKKTGSVMGTGLGLAIVKAVALAHGGTVEVVSALGKGSTFRILLPVGEDEGGVSGPEEISGAA